MKASTINETIDARLSEGTNSTLDFKREYGWGPRSGSIFSELSNLDSMIEAGRGKIQYTASFRGNFLKLLPRIHESDSHPFSVVKSAWQSKFPVEKQTRSNFEETAKELVRGRRFSAEELASAMQIINSVNHYAYAYAMKDLGDVPFVDTRELRYFYKLTESIYSDDYRSVSIDTLEELLSRRVFDTISKELKFPLSVLRDPQKWGKLSELLDTSASTSSSVDFRIKKSRVLNAVHRLLDGADVGKSEYELTLACRDYSKFLISELGSKSERRARVFFQLGLEISDKAIDEAFSVGVKGGGTVAATGLGLKFGGPLGALAGFVGSVVISFAIDNAKPRVSRIIDRLTAKEEYSRDHSARKRVAQYASAPLTALSIKKIRGEAL
jgi:hypothetical protein